jgi:DNA-binding MarR family transcriptional regulator
VKPAGAGSDALAVLQKFRYVIRAAQRHSQWIEGQTGLPGAQLWLLAEVNAEPGVRAGELARKMALHQSTASNLIERLVARGLVERLREPSDARIVRLGLTAAGERLLARAPEPARGLLPQVLQDLDAAALQRLAAGLDEVIVRVRALDERFEGLPLPFTE